VTDISLPHADDLMLPVLKAAHEAGKARYEVIDELAINLAGVTEEQLAIVFSDSSSQTGPKVYHRAAWARSILKRIGLMESHGSGVWGMTEKAVEYLAMPDDEADAALRRAANEAYQSREPSDERLAEMKTAALKGQPEQLSARELIGLWGVERRWSSANDRIVSGLAKYGLGTDPDFVSGGLDQQVKVVLLEEPPESQEAATDRGLLRVGTLPSATAGVASVTPHDGLRTAQTLMWTNDYSQLAVMNGSRDLKGAVSWESIARARLRNPNAELKECIVEAVDVKMDTPLLEAVRLIIANEFFFVRSQDNTVTGIVTTMDLSDQFASLAGPFLTLGEIERLLRIPIDATFTTDEMSEVLLPDDDRIVDGSHSLSLGEIQRLLDQPSNWERLEWPADRQVFIKALNTIREIRNEIMHFSPDPIEKGRLEKLDAFLKMVRELVSAGHQPS
jgi:hypothetical protein